MKNSILKLLTSTIAMIFVVINSYGQPGDYTIVNETDCSIEVRVTLFDYSGPACASNGTELDDTGWITVSANSTHVEPGSGYAQGWWNKAEVKNPDFPASCTDPPDVIEEAGPNAGRSQDGASCDCADIKIWTDNCDKATIEVGN